MGPELEQQQQPLEYPFWTYTDLGLVLGVGAPCFLIGFLACLGLLRLLPLHAKGIEVVLPQFVGYACAAIPAALLFRAKHDRSLGEAAALRLELRYWRPSIVLGIATAAGVLVAGTLLRMPQIETPMEELLSDNLSLIVIAIFGSTLGPLVEELLFRGLLQPLTIASAGVVPGILIAALPFALLHGPQYGWSWRHIVMIVLAGAAFGWWRHRTQSTGAATVMHAAYNLFLFAGFIAGRFLGAEIPQAT
jgi:membrane protease YdiL (CAAX protease family)